MTTAIPKQNRSLVAFGARAWQYGSTRAGLVMIIVIVLVAVLGPLFAPHAPDEIIELPFSAPGSGDPLGTDFVGRDVLSRILYGGRMLLVLPVLATALCYLIALPIGILAGYKRGWVDNVIMRPIDLLVSIPFLVFVIALFTGVGSSPATLVVGIGVASVPFAARMIRSVAREISSNGYVEVAYARGDSNRRIIAVELLPNMITFLIADATIRLSQSVLAIASLSYLGFGVAPPAADWALMISENRVSFAARPLAVIIPACLIAAFTIAVALFADGLSAASGRSSARRQVVI